jgi:MFS family permease
LTAVRHALTTLQAALSSSAMRRVLLGYLGFATAEWATWIAVLLYAFQVHGPTAVGLVAVLQLAPAIVVAPLGSTVSERLARQAALVLAYSLLGASMAALWLVLVLHSPFWVFCCVAIVSNCTVTFARPAHYAALPRIAQSPDELVASNSASATLDGLGTFLGPAVLAVFIPLFGLSSVFATLFAVMLVAVIAIGRITGMPTEPIHRHAVDPESTRGFVHESLGGMREVRQVRGATTLLLLVGVQFVIIGMLDVLGVVFPQEVFHAGPSGASLLIAVSGIGALVGSAATVMLVGRRRMSPAFVLGFVGTGTSLALVSITPTLAAAMLLVGLSGFSRAFIDVSGRTLLQRTVREDVLARVFGLQESVLMAGLALGSTVAPVAIAATSARGAFVVAGLAPAVLALAAWPSLQRLDRRSVLPGPAFAMLRELSMFAPLPQARLELLARSARISHASVGQVIVRVGEHGDRFYVVTQGEVRIVRGGREVARLGPGEHFGEVALLRDAPRNATVTALQPTELLELDREEFLAAVTGFPASHAVAEQVAQQREDPSPGPEAGATEGAT